MSSSTHVRSAYEEISLQAAKQLVQSCREARDVSYKDLCKRLEAYEVHLSPQALINKLNRGTYSFGFALLVLEALGVAEIKVPKLLGTRPVRRAPGPGSGQ